MAAIDLAARPFASPRAMSIFNGHLQWQDLINRPLLSCLDDMYGFIRREPENLSIGVDENVLSEALLNMSLFPFWCADLTRPWWDFLPCSDASPSFGFGGSVAKCAPDLVRSVAAASAEPLHHIRLTWEEGDPIELPRCGQEFRIPIAMRSFKDLFSSKAKVVSHSGAMELQAAKLLLLRLTRVLLLDAQAICGALEKGRSSAGTLKRGVKAISAISLACGLRMRFPYIPSESMPADFPSRNKVHRRAVKQCVHKIPSGSSILDLDRAYRRAWRRARQCWNL